LQEARAAIPQGLGEAVPIFRRGIDLNVNVFGERGGSVEHSGLPADEQVLGAAITQALEKVCDHPPL
jgi:hypothetical protein